MRTVDEVRGAVLGSRAACGAAPCLISHWMPCAFCRYERLWTSDMGLSLIHNCVILNSVHGARETDHAQMSELIFPSLFNGRLSGAIVFDLNSIILNCTVGGCAAARLGYDPRTRSWRIGDARLACKCSPRRHLACPHVANWCHARLACSNSPRRHLACRAYARALPHALVAATHLLVYKRRSIAMPLSSHQLSGLAIEAPSPKRLSAVLSA